MALQVNKSLKSGFDAASAYAQIIECKFNSRRGISVSVHFYKDKAARTGGRSSIDGETYRFDYKPMDPIVNDLDEPISIKEYCYGLLKLHSDFKDAIDV